MTVDVLATVEVTETREIRCSVPVSDPEAVNVREVEDALAAALPFDQYRVTDYEVLADADE